MNNSIFIEKIKSVNPFIGTFEILEEYKGIKTKILCKNKYGLCKISPENLLKGSNLTINSSVNKTEYWINMANEKYNNLYDYSLVNYIDWKTPIKIICQKHGIFQQTPNAHINRGGCKKCGNENTSKARRENPTGWSLTNWIKAAEKSKQFDSFKVYIIKCYNEYEVFYKIGRTFLSVFNRFKSCQSMPYKYEIVKVYTSNNCKDIFKLENDLKNKHKHLKYKPLLKFHGRYECYSNLCSDL